MKHSRLRMGHLVIYGFVFGLVFGGSGLKAQDKPVSVQVPVTVSVPAPKETLGIFPEDGITTVKMKYGNFGEFRIFKKTDTPEALIVLANGDGGFDKFFLSMVKGMIHEKTMIVAFDTLSYLKKAAGKNKKCLYPAGDIELLSKFVQSKLKLKQYLHPVLVGYSSGATLGYGAMVQAPTATFQGGISLGFCSDLESAIPLCKGAGLLSEPVKKGKKKIPTKAFDYAPSTREMPNWMVLGGNEDQVCPMDKVEAFVAKVPKAKSIRLPKVGHGFLVQKEWVPQFQDALDDLVGDEDEDRNTDALTDLPLIPLPVENSKQDYFVVFLSGDGGWAGFDRDVSATFIKDGVPVVGWNSLKYFWTPRTPEQGAADLNRIIEEYAGQWKKKKVVVVGFSFGADVAPFFVSRLPAKTQKMVQKIVMVSPGKAADFEFHFSDWIADDGEGQAIQPEVLKISERIRIQCLYGENEGEDSVCPEIKGRADSRKLPGGHHLDAEPEALYGIIK